MPWVVGIAIRRGSHSSGIAVAHMKVCVNLRKFGIVWGVGWCPPRESNTAPTDYESAALTRHELEGHSRARQGMRQGRNYCIKASALTSGAFRPVLSSAEKARRQHEAGVGRDDGRGARARIDCTEQPRAYGGHVGHWPGHRQWGGHRSKRVEGCEGRGIKGTCCCTAVLRHD